MHFSVLLLLALLIPTPQEKLVLEVPAPTFQLSQEKTAEGQIPERRIFVEGCQFMGIPGAPKVPCRHLTVAVPPGALVDSVEFFGERQPLGTVTIPPAEPVLPLSGEEAAAGLLARHAQQEKRFYASNRIFPERLGALHSKGGLRKYSLVTIACHHFAYQPATKQLHYAPTIRVEINYRMPDQDSERAKFWQGLMQDTTFDEMAEAAFYNWDQAQGWYGTRGGRSSKRYTIIIPTSIQSAVDTLVAYRQQRGFQVDVVTREHIILNATGVDLQEKIRNYLRANLAELHYVLLVGKNTDLPWRSMVPFNDNPSSPYGGADYSPIPSDLYYAELTDPDHLSWDVDGDGYYGEVYDNNMMPVGHDSPDYHADIHLGRIPLSNFSNIEKVCKKLITFDENTDRSYKSAALFTGAMYYFANENYSGGFRLDGADFTEALMDDGIVDRANAVYLYETAGINPSYYSCTAPLNKTNQVGCWQGVGVMYECHHGNYNVYARKYWAFDDGDGVPENHEFQWPNSLHINHVSQLDNDRPATTFLRSCLCGKPEVNSLGAALLVHGSSAVICSSRIAWLSLKDMGGIPHHFYDRLLKNKGITKGMIGPAYDMARTEFMDVSGFWIIPYHYNLFGDPAIRQFGWPPSVIPDGPPQKAW